jgi:hypothetical protein
MIYKLCAAHDRVPNQFRRIGKEALRKRRGHNERNTEKERGKEKGATSIFTEIRKEIKIKNKSEN